MDDLLQAFLARFNHETPGWGQFLDAPQGPHGTNQIGRYGSSAGAIVLGLTDQKNSQIAQRVLPLLLNWAQDVQSARSAQTLPLAMLTIGIGYLREGDDELKAVQQLLFTRQLKDGLWGDYWIDEQQHTEQTSPFVSAFVLIACYLTGLSSDERVTRAALALQEFYLRDPDKYCEFDPIISVAIALLLGRRSYAAIKSDLKRFALKPVDLAKRFNYFYDYQSADGKWGREYFIVPLDLVAALALHQARVPTSIRLKAQTIVRSMEERLDASGHLRLAEGNRLSTLEHGCAALALQALLVDDSNSSWFGPSWLHYQLRRERPSLEKIGSRITLFAYLLLALNYGFAAIWGLSFEGWDQLGMGASTFMLGVIREPIATFRSALGMSQ